MTRRMQAGSQRGVARGLRLRPEAGGVSPLRCARSSGRAIRLRGPAGEVQELKDVPTVPAVPAAAPEADTGVNRLPASWLYGARIHVA